MKDTINMVGEAIIHVGRCDDSTAYINLNVLNNGATDGLVRNRGELIYDNISYPIERSEDPSSDGNTMAVPTYVVNKSFSNIQSNSVGKIEKNSMVELWYMLPTGQNNKDVCNKGGEFKIVLFDQNKSIVDNRFNCRDVWR